MMHEAWGSFQSFRDNCDFTTRALGAPDSNQMMNFLSDADTSHSVLNTKMPT